MNAKYSTCCIWSAVLQWGWLRRSLDFDSYAPRGMWRNKSVSYMSSSMSQKSIIPSLIKCWMPIKCCQVQFKRHSLKAPYLLRARRATFEGGPLEGATGAFGVHAEDVGGSRRRSKPTSAPERHCGSNAAQTVVTLGKRWTSMSASSPFTPLRSAPTDKTHMATGDINHSMAYLTHRPFSSAAHPVIRINAADRLQPT